jgi:sulfonate transport system permease protein
MDLRTKDAPAAAARASERPAPRLQVVRRVPRRTLQQREAHVRRTRILHIALGTAVPIALLLLWEIASATGLLDERVFPRPTQIAVQSWELITSGRLPEDVWATTRRILAGFAIGTVLGFLVGAGMGASRTVRAALDPLLSALYVIPHLTMLPIFLSIFGFGEAPLIALITTACFFYVWIGTMTSLIRVPTGYLEAAHSLGISRRQGFRSVLLPAILPQLFVSLRMAMAVSVLMTVAAEFIIGGTGLGYLIFNSGQLLINGWMYAGIVTVSLLGLLLTGAVTLVGRWVTPWERTT